MSRFPASPGPAVRRFLARRPWVVWAIVALAGIGTALVVHAQLGRLDEARRSWGETRPVLAAERDLVAGEELAAVERDFPVAVVPESALEPRRVDRPVVLARDVGRGEIVTSADLAPGSGPLALAPSGSVVLRLPAPDGEVTAPGAGVAVYAEGLVLADHGVVVRLDGELALVAVDEGDAAVVAAAAAAGSATLALLAG